MSQLDTNAGVMHGSAGGDGHDAGDGSSHGHGHAQAGEPLGPIDLAAWVYAAGGALVGLVTAAALYVAANA
jgi:hypothetical protein